MKSAEQIYKTFTKFDPDRIETYPLLWPDQRDLCLLGQATSISYRSDKWSQEGEPTDYIHIHDMDPPVLILTERIQGYPPAPAPPAAPPGFKFSLLGKYYSHCLDLTAILASTGHPRTIDFCRAPLFPWLAAHPDGHTLVIVYPNTIPILVTGPGLRITADGIEG